jgi:anti-sigma-K factor RskA
MRSGRARSVSNDHSLTGIALARLDSREHLGESGMPNTDSTEQDLLNAQVAKLRLEARKLEREIDRLGRPFWTRWSFWRSMLAASAVGAAAWAGLGRFA